MRRSMIKIIRAEGRSRIHQLVIDDAGKKAEKISVTEELETNTVTKTIIHVISTSTGMTKS